MVDDGVKNAADADLAWVATDLGRTRVNGLHGKAQVGFVNADPDEDAVRDPAGHAQRLRALRGDPHRYPGSVAEHCRSRGVDCQAFARIECPDGADRFFECRDGGRSPAHEAHGGVAHTHAQ